MNFKTNWNHGGEIPAGERFLMPSLTVPGQGMTVKDIVNRFASGYPLDAGKIKEPFDSDIVDKYLQGRDIRTLDLSEVQEIREAVQAEIDELNEKVAKEKNEEYNKAVEEAAAKKLAEFEAAKKGGENVDPA